MAFSNSIAHMHKEKTYFDIKMGTFPSTKTLIVTVGNITAHVVCSHLTSWL